MHPDANVEIIRGGKGDFIVKADGRLLWDKNGKDRDFPAPDINVYPSSFEPPEAPEPEIHQAVESSEEVAELVRNFTGIGTWEDEGVQIHVFRRALFIRTYPKVHREVARFLTQLEALR